MKIIFYNCTNLTSIDLSSFNIKQNIDLKAIFFGCRSLKYINISRFIFESNIALFDALPENCEIKINNKSYGKIETIPNSCNIITEL